MRDPSLLDPTIRAHLESENAYAEAMLATTVPLQDTLFAEMKGRIKEDDASVPAPDGAFSYFTRYRDGGQHPLVCREPRGRRRARDPARRRRARLRQGVLPPRRHRAFARSQAARLERGRNRRGAVHRPGARPRRAWRDLPDLVPETAGAHGVDAGRAAAFYYVRRRPPAPSVERAPPPPRHRRPATTSRSMRRATAASSSRCRSCSPAASPRFRCTTTKPPRRG